MDIVVTGTELISVLLCCKPGDSLAYEFWDLVSEIERFTFTT